jgi:hypothetical protein
MNQLIFKMIILKAAIKRKSREITVTSSEL